MTGTHADAARALDGAFECIGAGSRRKVYRNGDVVYKVERYAGEHANAHEILTFRELSKETLPANIRIPDTSLYVINGRNVIAMDYVPGQVMAQCFCGDNEECTRMCLPANDVPLIKRYLNDIYGLNIVKDIAGNYWLIDLE